MRYDSLTIQTSGFFDVLVNEQILICEFTNHQSASNRSTSRVRIVLKRRVLRCGG